jgi:DNA-binding MarR family transcriptional regulator
MGFKISKTKEYAVLYLHRTTGMSINAVADALNIAVSTVEKILKDNPTLDSNKNFIHETRDKRSRNVAIMTKEGSTSGDSIQAGSAERKETIFKPRG